MQIIMDGMESRACFFRGIDLISNQHEPELRNYGIENSLLILIPQSLNPQSFLANKVLKREKIVTILRTILFVSDYAFSGTPPGKRGPFGAVNISGYLFYNML